MTLSSTEKAPFSGRLFHASHSGYVLLDVPNDFIRGAFNALRVPGIELPKHHNGKFFAHITVFTDDEVKSIGGKEKITELGKTFNYRIGGLREVSPDSGLDKVWFLKVISPEIIQLRKTYGLLPVPRKGTKEIPLHITVAIREKGVLRRGEKSKAD